jgi:hypothetical protein
MTNVIVFRLCYRIRNEEDDNILEYKKIIRRDVNECAMLVFLVYADGVNFKTLTDTTNETEQLNQMLKETGPSSQCRSKKKPLRVYAHASSPECSTELKVINLSNMWQSAWIWRRQ